jgi:uncharacterized iron-regulated membrane protein
MQKIGFVLVIIGAIMMFYTGLIMWPQKDCRYRPDRDKQTTKSSVQWSPILGVVLIIGGVVLMSG